MAIIGVTVGTIALVVVLSVFNGFEELVRSLFNSFNPDLQVTAKKGKIMDIDSLPVQEIKKIPGVVHLTEVLEENALIRYNNRQYIATIKGVGHEYRQMSGVDTMIIDGSFVLEDEKRSFAVVGAGIAYSLGLNLRDFSQQLNVYVPKRTQTGITINPKSAFNHRVIMPAGVFSVQQEFDTKYIIVPLDFARQILNYSSQITSIEIGLDKNARTGNIQEQLEKLLGENYEVKDRFQQQEMLYKIMKSEKWAIFLILSFILVIATFNVIGSLSMLIIDKKKDITILWSMGANIRTIRRIFIMEGLLITFTGALAGVIIGTLICWLQQTFGFIPIQTGASFVVSAYPVKIEATDIFMVMITVFIIGILTAFYPVKQISKKYLVRINE